MKKFHTNLEHFGKNKKVAFYKRILVLDKRLDLMYAYFGSLKILVSLSEYEIFDSFQCARLALFRQMILIIIWVAFLLLTM